MKFIVFILVDRFFVLRLVKSKENVCKGIVRGVGEKEIVN